MQTRLLHTQIRLLIHPVSKTGSLSVFAQKVLLYVRPTSPAVESLRQLLHCLCSFYKYANITRAHHRWQTSTPTSTARPPENNLYSPQDCLRELGLKLGMQSHPVSAKLQFLCLSLILWPLPPPPPKWANLREKPRNHQATILNCYP